MCILDINNSHYWYYVMWILAINNCIVDICNAIFNISSVHSWYQYDAIVDINNVDIRLISTTPLLISIILTFLRSTTALLISIMWILDINNAPTIVDINKYDILDINNAIVDINNSYYWYQQICNKWRFRLPYSTTFMKSLTLATDQLAHRFYFKTAQLTYKAPHCWHADTFKQLYQVHHARFGHYGLPHNL